MALRVRQLALAMADAIRTVNLWRTAAIGLGLLLLTSLPSPTPAPDSDRLLRQVNRLAAEVHHLQQERAMPAAVLERHRNSICFLYGIYSFGSPKSPVRRRMRISGTGFVVADGLIATNRHVAEPWFEDPESQFLMRLGARPRLDKLVAFFPNQNAGVLLSDVRVSDKADLAVARFRAESLEHRPEPLPLASAPGVPGDSVVVIGYPMGTVAMVAKSPKPVYRRLAYRRDGIGVAEELAALSLIRPSATHGHLGDVVGDKLIYDAATAHGGSGGPVFDSRGMVIGVNAAYLDGFAGSTLGISVEALKPLITKTPAKPAH